MQIDLYTPHARYGLRHLRQIEAQTIAARKAAPEGHYGALHAASLEIMHAFATNTKAARRKAITQAETALSAAAEAAPADKDAPHIIETRHVERFGNPFTLVMAESIADDVAVYEHSGHVTGEHAAMAGTKWTAHEAACAGFDIPDGKHYRR
jgi:hypothetical protein